MPDFPTGFTLLPEFFRDVAQPGSAHVWGAWGRKFKSCHPDERASNFWCSFFMLTTNADKGFGLLSFLNMCPFQEIFYSAELPKKCSSHLNLGIKWVSKI